MPGSITSGLCTISANLNDGLHGSRKTGILAVAERPLKVAVGFNPRIVNDRNMASRRDALSGWEPFGNRRFHASRRDRGFQPTATVTRSLRDQEVEIEPLAS